LLYSFAIAGVTNMGLPVQYGIELTYPEPVPVMVGILTVVQWSMMLILTNVGQALIEHPNLENGGMVTTIVYCCLLCLSIIIQIPVKERLNREDANFVPTEYRRYSYIF